MANFLKNSFVRVLFLANIVIVAFYFISKAFDSFAAKVGKIGVTIPNHVPWIGGLCIPGSGLKTFVNLFEGPFKFVASNIKLILIVDALFIVIAILFKISQKEQQKCAIDEVASAESKEEKKAALSNLMKSFK